MVQALKRTMQNEYNLDLAAKVDAVVLDMNPGLRGACAVEFPDSCVFRCLQHALSNLTKNAKKFRHGNQAKYFQNVFDCTSF